MIDDVILMADGQIMYAGPASQVVPYFGARGYLCPHYVNPADFLFMNVLNRAGGNSAGNASPGSVDLVADSTKRSRSSGSIEAAESLMEKGDASMTRSASTAPQDSAIIQYLLQEWIASDLGKAQDALARSGSESGVQGFDNAQKKYHSGFLTQFLVLIKRVWSNAWRNEAILRVKFLEVLFISFFTDAIFWKIPEKGLESQIQVGYVRRWGRGKRGSSNWDTIYYIFKSLWRIFILIPPPPPFPSFSSLSSDYVESYRCHFLLHYQPGFYLLHGESDDLLPRTPGL